MTVLSVVILTFNSEATIGATLASVRKVANEIHVVDSGSTDGTIAIAREAGANVHSHAFENYGAQRNWAIETLPLRGEWQLHLDADERLSDALIGEIQNLCARKFAGPGVGYFVPRLVHFLGGPIRHGGMYPIWHMRLFKTGHGRCENRLYDQHFLVDGPTGQLKHPFIDDMRMPLTEWMARHIRWAKAEATELYRATQDGGVREKFSGNPVERKRALRGLYNRSPMFLRAVMLFIYRYLLRLGFLDGWRGTAFFLLQTFWFRFLVDLNLYELRRGITKPE